MVFPIELLQGNTLYCSELQLREYKEILKCTYGEDIDKASFVRTVSEILARVASEHKTFFLNEIGIVDVFRLLIKIRSISLGNEIQIKLGENRSASIDIDKLDEIIQPKLKKYEGLSITQSNTELVFASPSLGKSLNETTNGSHLFLKRVTLHHNKTKQTFNINTTDEASLLLNKITAKHLIQFENAFQDYTDTINSINFIEHISTELILPFIPTLDNLIWYTKFLFNEPLETLYNNIFYLAKLGNMSPEYMEKCSPGEYIYFSKQLEQSIRETSGQGSTDEMTINEDIDGMDENFDDIDE
jgi:hypothetical protein